MARKALNSGAVVLSLTNGLSWRLPTVPLTVVKKGIISSVPLSQCRRRYHFRIEFRFRASQYTARFGEYNLRVTDPGESEIFQISEIRIHPQFTGTGFYNDLALFKLERPVSFSDYIQPICLPSNSQRTESFIGQVPTIVGWGTTYYGKTLSWSTSCFLSSMNCTFMMMAVRLELGGRESTVLREVQLPVWRNDDCDRAYLQPITDVFICAGYADGGKDACQVIATAFLLLLGLFFSRITWFF